jgi:iron complex outermembrane receptor protein
MRRTFLHRIVLSAVVFLFVNSSSFSQNGAITGRVQYGKEVLHDATVSLGDKIKLTDKNGEFSFSVKPGNYIIIITHAGYKKQEHAITVDVGSVKNFEFELVPNELLGEVVTLGSRSNFQRSNLNTPVPVDVFSSVRLKETGEISLTQMLNRVAPSFNASREINNEPSTLRGLDPDHVLIHMNGIRYHNAVFLYAGNLKGQLGHGSVGNDLNSIPFSAIEKVEILRDGASAQFGSDATAGVINIQLKKSTGKTSIQLHTGQFYEGDGEKFSIGINRGISLNKKGSINFSASYRYQEPTFRGGIYQGPVYYDTSKYPLSQRDGIIALDNQKVSARGFNRRAAAYGVNVGNLRQFSIGFLVNGGYRLSDRAECFWTAAFNSRKLDQRPGYRLPKDSNYINFALYPDGFATIVKSTIADLTLIAGINGKTKNLWRWDFATSYGINSSKGYATHTNNASQSYLGAYAPTSFSLGEGDLYKLLTNNINFAKSYSRLPGKMKTLNLAWGAEWRFENYHSTIGDSASWYDYDSTGPKQGGSAPGPENALIKFRNVLGAYLEIESDLTNDFLINAAGRYEYYSEFGGNLAGKLAARYKFSEKLSLRASISNGFRAPSLQQRYFTAIRTAINSGAEGPRLGTFPNGHQVVKAFHIPSLTAEKTINLSAGFASAVSNHINLTVDAYWIQIRNRIVISGSFDKTNPTAKKMLDSLNSKGISINSIQFFTNAINTRTRGIDIILNGNWNIHTSNLSMSLAANFTSTRLFGGIKTSDKIPADSLNTNTLFNIDERTKMEKGQPCSKIILSMTYKTGKTKILITNTGFGKTSIAPIYQNPLRIDYESFSPRILTDASLSYRLKKWITITLGANNIFNVYPDRLKNYENTSQGVWIYSPEASPFGFNGGYYYINMDFNF